MKTGAHVRDISAVAGLSAWLNAIEEQRRSESHPLRELPLATAPDSDRNVKRRSDAGGFRTEAEARNTSTPAPGLPVAA
jgi:hypothetical protein